MRKILIPVAAVLLVLLGAGVAWASIPGPDGVIHGCYKTNNPNQGALITIDSAASCPSGYTALNWNQTGPPGLSGITTANNETTVSAQSTEAKVASCPSGKVALSGGYTLDRPDVTFVVVDAPSISMVGDVPTSWIVQFQNSDTVSVVVQVLVVCATVAS